MITRCRSCGCEDLEVLEYGPELPDLIYANDGTVWGRRHRGSYVWWYGSRKLVTWSTLVRIRAGKQPLLSKDRDDDEFPWAPWAGANYGDDDRAIRSELEATPNPFALMVTR